MLCNSLSGPRTNKFGDPALNCQNSLYSSSKNIQLIFKHKMRKM